MRTAADPSAFPRPRLVLSRCLELDACRYDGALVHAPFVRRLEPYAELIPVCPEVQIGLGVPRDPIRLVRGSGETALVQPATGRDLSATMAAFSARFLAGLPEVDGFLLKARSPSCGIHDVKLFGDAASDEPEGRGAGMFAAAVVAAYPDHPAEDEIRLDDPRLLDRFLTRLFVTADVRDARIGDDAAEALQALHARYDLLWRTLSESRRRELDALVRGAARPARAGSPASDEAPVGAIGAAYARAVRRALADPVSSSAHAAVLALAAEALPLGPAARADLARLIEDYRAGRHPRARAVAGIRMHAAREALEEPAARIAHLAPYPVRLGSPLAEG